MPIKETAYKSVLTSDVSSFIERKRTEKNGGADGVVEFLSIIEFVEAFKLMPFGLYPTQRFILKMYYNLPLDGVNKTISFKNKKHEMVSGDAPLLEFTEVEYLKYLYDNGRCNIREQDGRERRELILVIGRRSGKSALAAIIAAYELYKLLRRGHPQSYYGIPSGSEIRLLTLANDKEQASIVYGDMQSHVEAIDYFKSSLANTTQTFMKFRTDNDKKKFGDGGKASLSATFKSSIAKGLRGRGIICAILDELAFFVDDGKSSAERVYKAIMPSLAQFSPKDPKNKHVPTGPTEGRMIIISSPDSKEGFFYRIYQQAMSQDRGASDMLVLQAPTWEVNPTLDRSYYEKEFFKDPNAFMTEHGAEFSDRVRGWIEDSRDLEDCIPKDQSGVSILRPAERGVARDPHFAGVDLGLTNDGTAISLTHIRNGKVELAYHEVWYPKKRWRDANPHLTTPIVPYALTLHDQTRLDIYEIAAWIKALSQRFFIYKGVMDQHLGNVFEVELHKQGLKQFELRNFFTSDSSHMYQTFKTMMYSKQIALYDYPVPVSADGTPTSRHSPLIEELLELQAASAGKNMVIVEAPKVAGKHDDMSDSLARSVLLASEYIKENPGILDYMSLHQAIPRLQAPPGYSQYHRMRARMHGGRDRLRTPPRLPRR